MRSSNYSIYGPRRFMTLCGTFSGSFILVKGNVSLFCLWFNRAKILMALARLLWTWAPSLKSHWGLWRWEVALLRHRGGWHQRGQWDSSQKIPASHPKTTSAFMQKPEIPTKMFHALSKPRKSGFFLEGG